MWRYIGHILYIRSNNYKNDNNNTNNNNNNNNNNNKKNKCGETQKKWFKPILLIVTSSILFLVSIDWTYNGTWNGSTVSIDIGPYCQVFLTPACGWKSQNTKMENDCFRVEKIAQLVHKEFVANPLTPRSAQDRISPDNININNNMQTSPAEL